ncbi:MAG: hypothetical protein OEX82_09040, partial [Nitrosomonas sp.]|nr:hypothetical protein [Nitrosomonas sp.]
MKSIFIKYKKELAIMLTAILFVLSVSTYFMHDQNMRLLVNEHSNKLSSLKSALKIHIEDYFDTTHDVVLTLGASQTTINAINEFSLAFEEDVALLEVDQSLLENTLNAFLG